MTYYLDTVSVLDSDISWELTSECISDYRCILGRKTLSGCGRCSLCQLSDYLFHDFCLSWIRDRWVDLRRSVCRKERLLDGKSCYSTDDASCRRTRDYSWGDRIFPESDTASSYECRWCCFCMSTLISSDYIPRTHVYLLILDVSVTDAMSRRSEASTVYHLWECLSELHIWPAFYQWLGYNPWTMSRWCCTRDTGYTVPRERCRLMGASFWKIWDSCRISWLCSRF